MFTQSCFIRNNNKRLMEKLIKIGYTECMTIGDLSCIVISNNNDCWNGSFDLVSSDVIDNIRFRKHHVDCGENEELFLAIASLRDDTDKYQLFFHNKDTECKYPLECNRDEFHLIQVDAYMFRYEDHKDEYHKGTSEELIKHFK